MSSCRSAKAAINHLVTSMAVELGPEGIRVLAMAPGTTMTETVAAAFTPERVDQIVASTPLRRMVEHDEDPARARRPGLLEVVPQPRRLRHGLHVLGEPPCHLCRLERRRFLADHRLRAVP